MHNSYRWKLLAILMSSSVTEYLLSRDWEVLKWRPILKVLQQLQDKCSEEMQNCYRWKSLAILMSNIPMCSPKPQLLILTLKIIEREIFDFHLLLSLLFFFFSIKHNSKVYGVYERSTNQTNDLLSQIFLGLVRDACELRSTSYGQKNAWRWLFCTPFCA